MATIRKAKKEDIDYIEKIYNDILSSENNTGWIKGVYPTRETAKIACDADELFVLENNDSIVVAARINQTQEKEYSLVKWQYPAKDKDVMVLHTLVTAPQCKRCGYGTQFIGFYEKYAKENGCTVLRLDTNEKNLSARAFYAKLGFYEVGTINCRFNGIENVNLVCMEKHL